MKKIYLFAFFCFLFQSVDAQTTLTTGTPNASTNTGAGPLGLTFAIQNGNSYAIVLNAMDVYRGASSSGTAYSLLYSATSLSGTANLTTTDWTGITVTTASAVTTTAIHPTFNSLGFIIPANTTYRFAVVTSGNELNCGTTGTNSFTSSGVTIKTGNSQISAQNIGYAGPIGAVSTGPRYWGGTISFSTAAACIAPPVAGTTTVTNATPCGGAPIAFNISGNTTGLNQAYQWQSASSQTGPWANEGSSQSLPYRTANAPGSTLYYRALVTCNSQVDSSSPVLVTIAPPFASGTYTIDNTQPTGGSNFNSFASAAAAINCGISGPIVFNVQPGVYNNDYFRIDSFVNAPGNSITINGNGATISNVSSLSSEPGIITLRGTKHVTIDSLNIQGISSSTTQYAWGVFMTNGADSNTVTNCTITLDTTSSAANYAGIVLSGSSFSATSVGALCDRNTISNNTINGGYYGIALAGNSGATLQGNIISGNVIRNFYSYGIYTNYSDSMLIENNDVSRISRTSLTTFYGIYAASCKGFKVSANRIHDPAPGDPSTAFIFYGIYVASTGGNITNTISNNLIYNIQGNNSGTSAVYGLYNLTGIYTEYYYNTVLLDDVSSTAAGPAYGFYQSSTATSIKLRNNNIYIARAGIGPKYGIFVNTATSTINSDNNNVYVNGAGGSNYFGYYAGSTQVGLSNWQTASSQDINSVTADPYFVNPAQANFQPANVFLNDKGSPVAGITSDITGALRSSTPDIGAYEFSLPACSSAPAAGTSSGPSSVCPGSPFTLYLTGYSGIAGITIQWQSSPAGAGLFSNISGATSPVFTTTQSTATDYLAIVTCTNGGGSGTSNTVTVQVNPFYTCYCSPNTGTILHSTISNNITNVSIVNTTLNSATTAAGNGGYTWQNPQTGSNTATLSAGVPYTINVTLSLTSKVSVWIDYDHSGTFDNSEYIALTTASGVASGTINVPITAMTGLTGMRVRATSSSTTNYTASEACTSITLGRETEDYVIDLSVLPCQLPIGFTVTSVSTSGAAIKWTSVAGATGYEWNYGTAPSLPTSGTSITDTSVVLSSLSPATPYYLFVRTNCGSSGYSSWAVYSFNTLAINDDPWNAIPLTVGASCTGSPYANLGSSQGAGEPFPSCYGGASGYYTVWYSFVAPASGAVKITTDIAGGTIGDARLALYSTTNVNNYASYTILACDNDNGGTVANRPLVYVTGLTSGTTYYIQVDAYDAGPNSNPGTFCMEVQELSASMVASSGSCTAGQTNSKLAGYTGSLSMVDAAGNLVAIVNNPASDVNIFSANLTKTTGAVRSSGGQYYLDRNFFFVYLTNTTTAPINLQLFFSDAELTNYQTVVPGASLSNINVTRQSATGLTSCTANFTPSTGTNTGLVTASNGSVNGANWVTASFPGGFSSPSVCNLFLQSGAPLAIHLTSLSAINAGNSNRIYWKTGTEAKGDYFELERSGNGSDFIEIGKISGRGEPSNYQFIDNQPLSGINYYRLKMTSAGGAFEYSATVSAAVRSDGFVLNVYPNPVNGILTTSISGKKGNDAVITISDVTGKIIRTLPVSTNEIMIDMNVLAPGIYMLRYRDSNTQQTIKLTKE